MIVAGMICLLFSNSSEKNSFDPTRTVWQSYRVSLLVISNPKFINILKLISLVIKIAIKNMNTNFEHQYIKWNFFLKISITLVLINSWNFTRISSSLSDLCRLSAIVKLFDQYVIVNSFCFHPVFFSSFNSFFLYL